MSTDAVVRVKLDTAGARSDLAALYGDFRRAPAINVPGGGGGGGGGGIGVGGVAMGTAIGGMTASLLQSIMSSTAVRGTVSALQDELLFAAIGPKAMGGIGGAMASRQATSQMFGLAVGIGAMDATDPAIKAFNEMQNQFGAGAAERGGAQIRGALGGDTAEEIGKTLAEGFMHVVKEFLPELAKAILDAINPL